MGSDFKYLACELDPCKKVNLYVLEGREGLVWTNLERANLFVNIPQISSK